MDQKLKKDAGKLRYDLIPPEVLTALAEIYTFGLEKGYQEESWRDVELKRYIASTMRHFNDYRKDNAGLDEESGKHHVKHLLWNVASLVMKSCYISNNHKELPDIITYSKPIIKCNICRFDNDRSAPECTNCNGIDNFEPAVECVGCSHFYEDIDGSNCRICKINNGACKYFTPVVK